MYIVPKHETADKWFMTDNIFQRLYYALRKP